MLREQLRFDFRLFEKLSGKQSDFSVVASITNLDYASNC